MKNKYDECIIVEFSSIEEEEAYIRKQEKCSFQKVDRSPEMKAYIKKSIEYMYSITDEEGKQNINKILKNIKWLQEPEEF